MYIQCAGHHITRHHHSTSHHHHQRHQGHGVGPGPAPAVPADIHQPYHREPEVFAPHGLNPLPDGPFPLDLPPPRQFHPMGAAPSSASLVKYREEEGKSEADAGGGGLFYGDIPAIIKGGSDPSSSSFPLLTRYASTQLGGRNNNKPLFREPPHYLSSSPPVINVGTPQSSSPSQPFVAQHGVSPSSAPNPFMYNVPLPQTIIYDRHNNPDFAQEQPPQPLLKYHLIR